ncbi:hypothetical protein CD30_12905 [Ureibacillus massiliensis 4400831 = CIP 108448 = CCUG 49529]|uniref:HTH gntR-type domain-containing protein n=1 Tax=Ureibacillus massiliensis 4400831 = CIP 108448 = CCUG 49529 TaxID=1211035 RepID=A0A0A3IZE0_9BACL|nr:GntR family transcriptional regulator [Ureibacillus massiliensis]KGR90149.1 hypothetical protein CD30_12905 [Ureibacillus massiliensis 4400831 = CIP 108448 = CCUG 49529]
MKGYRTKKDIIYETLKKEIYEGFYEFNEKLVITHIAKRFSSSEIPVREAYNQLKSDGLIEFKPHIGAVVSSLSKEDIKNIFELRIELEGLATRLAVDHLNESDLEELHEIIGESNNAIEQDNYSLYEQKNIEFHMKIYNKCKNPLLVKTIKDLWNNTNRYPSVFKSNMEHVKISLQEHEDIYHALVQKNSVIAEEKMLKHKARAGREILRIAQKEFYEKIDESKMKEIQNIQRL